MWWSVSVANRTDSKVSNCTRTDSRIILQNEKDKSEKCTFHRVTKLYLDHLLGGVESIPYRFSVSVIGD